jgi:hypothetical protein
MGKSMLSHGRAHSVSVNLGFVFASLLTVALGCADILSTPNQFESHEALNGIMCREEASSNLITRSSQDQTPQDVPRTVVALLVALVSPLG